MAVGATLKDFCENTSVHGLAFVVESKSSILKRLAWMTIFLMCLSYAIMQIKESIDALSKVFYLELTCSNLKVFSSRRMCTNLKQKSE